LVDGTQPNPKKIAEYWAVAASAKPGGALRPVPTAVPPSTIREGLLNGTPQEVIEQAAEWRDHGLRYLVVANMSALQSSLRKGLGSSTPFFKILRGLKRL
jgi:alkanesulfonate monooxygenase SsuD/methylene tetrahydromethanopterin reductase-like flavin-dependent oxidoreductase (luciferase family)